MYIIYMPTSAPLLKYFLLNMYLHCKHIPWGLILWKPNMIRTQQEITGFLDSGSTLAANQQAHHSKKSRAKSRATKGGRKDTDTPQDPPEITQLKWKRVTKEERKRQRKHVNQPRNPRTPRLQSPPYPPPPP